MALNHIDISGRLVRSPEIKELNGGKKVCQFTVAVDRNFGDGADFVPVTAWNKTAEFVSKYFTKGSMIIVSGSLQSRNYETKDGEKRTAWEIVADQVHFCGMKSNGDNNKVADKPVMVEVDESDGDLPF